MLIQLNYSLILLALQYNTIYFIIFSNINYINFINLQFKSLPLIVFFKEINRRENDKRCQKPRLQRGSKLTNPFFLLPESSRTKPEELAPFRQYFFVV